MRSIIYSLALVLLLASAKIHHSRAAEPDPNKLSPPSVGAVIPNSVRIIGVDGESRPGAFGVVIFDGRFIALVDGISRRVVEISSDAPSHPSAASPR
jgi:hypothetical protein